MQNLTKAVSGVSYVLSVRARKSSTVDTTSSACVSIKETFVSETTPSTCKRSFTAMAVKPPKLLGLRTSQPSALKTDTVLRYQRTLGYRTSASNGFGRSAEMVAKIQSYVVHKMCSGPGNANMAPPMYATIVESLFAMSVFIYP